MPLHHLGLPRVFHFPRLNQVSELPLVRMENGPTALRG